MDWDAEADGLRSELAYGVADVCVAQAHVARARAAASPAFDAATESLMCVRLRAPADAGAASAALIVHASLRGFALLGTDDEDTAVLLARAGDAEPHESLDALLMQHSASFRAAWEQSLHDALLHMAARVDRGESPGEADGGPVDGAGEAGTHADA